MSSAPGTPPKVADDAKPNAMPKSAPKPPKPEAERAQEVSMFIKNVWFLLFYFLMLLMIASFGIIAET